MAKTVNILMLGGAKRVSFGRMLIEAGRRLGYKASLFSYELTAHVPVSAIATIIIGKRWADPDIQADLERICREKAIGIIIPFVDGAIEIAAKISERLGIFSPVSPAEVCRTMFDKLAADKAFRAAGLPVPSGEEKYPMIAKPRFGSASKGIVIVNSREELSQLPDRENFLIQQYIADREEYTVDCYVDITGRPLAVSPRLRIEVVGGEVMRTATVFDPDLVDLSKVAIERLGLRGAVTLQYLKDLRDNSLMLMEINPRLGGGVVCTVHAEVPIPEMILREALAPVDPEIARPEFACYRPYVEIARYMQEIVYRN